MVTATRKALRPQGNEVVTKQLAVLLICTRVGGFCLGCLVKPPKALQLTCLHAETLLASVALLPPIALNFALILLAEPISPTRHNSEKMNPASRCPAVIACFAAFGIQGKRFIS